MKRLLQCVWKYGWYAPASLVTTSGLPVEVFDTGIRNTGGGPDFLQVKIRIGSAVHTGNVQILEKASCWQEGGYDTDPVYDSVVLLVTGQADTVIRRTTGEAISQFVPDIPEHMLKNYAGLMQKGRNVACISGIAAMEPFFLSSWMSALLAERLERKTQDIFRLLEQYEGDWNEVFYITLCRSFGFGIHSDAMEALAKSIPLRCLQKHRGNIEQAEALLFGQAGLLDAPYPDSYYRKLQREYRFLQHKFGLKPVEYAFSGEKQASRREVSPVKLAQLAAVWAEYDTLFSLVREAETPELIRRLFRVQPSVYWETHYHFRYPSAPKQKILGENAINTLLINAVVPMMFAYGMFYKIPGLEEKALDILELLPAESNTIVSFFREAGVPVSHAGDSQALIQLKRVYCENKKCLYCRIGFKLLQRN